MINSANQKFYEILKYENTPILRTMDLDFLIEKPKENLPQINVPRILDELGFKPLFDTSSALEKFERMDLEIEFLSPRFRTPNNIVEIPHLNLTAQILSYMEIAQKYNEEVLYQD